MDFSACGFVPREAICRLATESEDLLRHRLIVVGLPQEMKAEGHDTHAFVGPDGAGVARGERWDEETLAHELLHILRVARGMPVLDEFKVLDTELEHVAIFPSLVELGFAPYAELTVDVLRDLVTPLLSRGPGRRDELRRAWRLTNLVWRVMLLSSSDAVHAKLLEMVGPVCPTQLEVGLEMAECIRRAGLSAPEKKIEAVKGIKDAFGISGALTMTIITPNATPPPALSKQAFATV